MKKIRKRLLALLLISAMMVTSASMTALAEGEDESGQTPEVVQEVTDEPEGQPASETVDEAEVTEASDNTGIAATSLDEGSAVATAVTGTKPSDGTTSGQPFITNTTGGSENFRIPAIVTLDDGTLVSAADARWNTTGDGGCLDTVVAYSADNGKNWNYTFANYLGDNGNVYNDKSTAFIDPVLATDGKTVYMMVDLWPGGIALNTVPGRPSAGTGFNDDGTLQLKKSGDTEYTYYLKDGKIYDTNNQAVENYTVDAYYNIYENDTMVSNVFFSDAPYQVFPTDYLYLTKSIDGGQTWSEPMILNSQVRTGNDVFYGVGPGAGLVLEDGTIMFPCYTYSNQLASFIYSKDGGATWKRSGTATTGSWSSESALVQIDETTVRSFYRDGNTTLYYTDYTYSNGVWTAGSSVNTNVTKTSNNQLSAIKYSKKIDGKTAILVSTAASGSGNRTNGKIYTFTLNADNTMMKAYEHTVTTGAYGYSSLTELNDGSIGLLYENASAEITYANLAINTVVGDAQIGTEDEEPSEASETKDITMYVGQSKTITDSTGNYESSYTGAGLDTSIATVNVKGTTAEGSINVSGVSAVSNGDAYCIQDSNGAYLKSDGKTTTNASEAAKWTLNSRYGGGYRLNNGNNYLRYNNNGLTTTTSNSQATTFYFSDGTLYRTAKYDYSIWDYTYSNPIGSPVTISTTDPVDATDITFTGRAAGATSVVVGNTKYNITVKEAPEILDVNTTPFVANTGVGKSKAITKLTTSVGLTFDIDLKVAGSNVEWSIADSSIATVDQNGKVTGVKAGETTVTATVDGVAYTIPVVIRQDTTSSSVKIYDFYLSEVTDTIPYYSVSMSTDLVEAQEGEAIYISCGATDDTAVDFFSKPKDGYALTRMSSTNSAGDYMALNSDTPSQTDFCTKSGAAGSNQINTFGSSAVYAMVQAALDKDCDGGMGWTRPSSKTSGVTSDLTFRSEKLPTVTKKVATVNGGAYTEGMVAHVGEKVVFDVTVTQYAAQDNITYSNASLKDNLTGATFKGGNSSTQTVSGLSNSALLNNKEITYQVEYTITDDDLDKTIVNTVDLNYTYKSQYSSGSFGGTANADAKFTAASFTPQDIVIDFGLPVELDFSGADAHGRYDLASGSATYGDVTVSGNKVIYAPKNVLLEADTVTLKNTAGGTYTFKVYPATSVYYEEGFATYSNGWNAANKGTGTQTASNVGSNAIYGYDEHYASNNRNSDGTVSSAGTTGAVAEFTFTGTGLDVYTLTTSDSGAMSMWLYNADTNTLLKFGYVDTHQDWLTNNDGSYYNTPVFSYKDLDANTKYKVVMKVVSGEVSLDGFRVYNTKGTAYENIYAQDKEDNADVVEVRDVAIAGADINISEVEDWYTYGDNIIKAVYDETNNGSGAIILSETQNNGITIDADMVNNGPKNEIYLESGQAIAMKINGSAAKVALGMRSLNGGQISCEINGKVSSNPGTSTVDMYYAVTLNNGMLVVKNTGSNVLALTKLKATEFNGNTTRSLAESISSDANTMAFALMCMANFEEVEFADATVNVNLVDYTGKVVATTVLAENGEDGAETSFGVETIKTAAEQVLPEGYGFADKASISDQIVVYGENVDVNIQVGKVATLQITYKKLFGKTVGTVTLTGVQTSSASTYTFSASEIRKAVPDGYWSGTLIGTKVKFGSAETRTVQVL